MQLTVLDQFAMKQPLPRNKGAKTISFFRRNRSAVATSGAGAGRVANVQTLTEGTAISSFANTVATPSKCPGRTSPPSTELGPATVNRVASPSG